MAAWHVGIIAIFFFAITSVPLAIANPLSFNHQSFKEGDMKLEGDASIYLNKAILITADMYSKNNISISRYSVGRVTSFHKMKLWDKTSGKLSDFWTKFTFSISPIYNRSDGLAFFLADPNLPFLQNIKEEGGLGLGDGGDQLLNSTKHSFVAVEFDTFQNPWDPSAWHAGININSMNSSVTVPVPTFPPFHRSLSFECNIEYNSTTQNLSVSYTGFDWGLPWTEGYFSYQVNLRDYLPEQVIVGFSGASKNLSLQQVLLSWSFSSSLDTQMPQTFSAKSKTAKSLGIGVGIVVAVSFIGFFSFLLWKIKKTQGYEEVSVCDLNMDDEFLKGSGPKKFSHPELVNATSNFSEAHKLGHGGFGDVYKGFIKDLNTEVAIKRMSRDSRQGINEYATEVKVISQLRHRNLVQLLGWCHKKKDLLLVYELMPNGSLDLHLHRGRSFLTWDLRYKIALDLASALLYLHEDWDQCVLHRDIKSSNIMLDSSFNGKLGDFGLARVVDHKKGSQTTRAAGTIGYIAPEYAITGKASKESDMYSFGVVLLEIVSGRKPIDLSTEEEKTIVEWVWELYGSGKLIQVAEPKLCGAFDEEQMERLVMVGIWCAHPDYSCRPSILQVIQVLKFEAPLPSLPLKMPVITFHPPTVQNQTTGNYI